ncbi:MAG: sugar-binding domain-containing protein [Promethearchaeota archaeon]
MIDNDLFDIEIPKSYNLLPGFESSEGIFWHFHQFELNEEKNILEYDYQIRFKGSNHNTKVWLNGRFLGEHNGGFTPFLFKITNLIKKKDNFIAIRVEKL